MALIFVIGGAWLTKTYKNNMHITFLKRINRLPLVKLSKFILNLGLIFLAPSKRQIKALLTFKYSIYLTFIPLSYELEKLEMILPRFFPYKKV